MAEPHLMRATVAQRIEQAWADREVAFIERLATVAPDFRGEAFPLAGGHAVLCGPGLFVNRAMGVALTEALRPDDLARLEARSAAVGVPASVELTPHAIEGASRLVAARGYHLDSVRTVVARALPASAAADEHGGDAVVITPLGPGDLELWQRVSRAGAPAEIARASDLFIATSAALDRDHGFVARDRVTGEPLGCGLVSVHARVATLGAMVTRPDARRRGVQRCLIAARLAFASARGCDLATASATTTSDSERNLVRAGFTAIYPQLRFTRG